MQNSIATFYVLPEIVMSDIIWKFQCTWDMFLLAITLISSTAEMLDRKKPRYTKSKIIF